MRILEELWHGNIEPAEFCTASSRHEYTKLLELVCKREDELKATLTGDQKALFAEYADSVSDYHAAVDCLLFQNSFRLGARMMLEIMEE